MEFLDYIKEARRYKTIKRKDLASQVKINLITNFTDDILQNLLTGIALHQNTYPVIYKTGYRQYHFDLKNPESGLYAHKPDITIIFFDINPFKESEFRASKDHFEEILADIKRYAQKSPGTVLVNTFIRSQQGAYGNLFKHDPLFALVTEYNEELEALSHELPNLTIFDANRLVQVMGESRVFDLRGLYAFDIPFTHEFMTALAEDWFAYIRALGGNAKKCVLLDLDNTLWGGVVGELGPTGIALGPDYPGNAFVNFQKALLELYHRGIILAIVSKNNIDDVKEVFEKNPHMVLKEKHFGAIVANWDEKAENIVAIARELNIGTDSMVFLDDDPVSRERVKAALPEVAVPDFSFAPEEYVRTLYAMNYFHQTSLTDEDKNKGQMYAEERERRNAREVAQDINEYIKSLNIEIKMSVNSEDLIPRLSQLTLKTNQCNLTTKRYSENDIKKILKDGAFVYSANVSDKFGDYGTVVLAIVIPSPAHVSPSAKHATLDTFLMSCRVMGRGIETKFLKQVEADLKKRGFTTLNASFIQTAKNKPAESFLEDSGFTAMKHEKASAKGKASFDIRRYTASI